MSTTVFNTPIIPSRVTYYELNEPRDFDVRAICCFCALGFFLDDDTYFKNKKAFKPASRYEVDATGNVLYQDSYFEWKYNPEERTLRDVVDEYAALLSNVIKKGISDKIILPLSGGLDSRTLAAAVASMKMNAHAYSYEFENGHPESAYGARIAQACNFQFTSWKVSNGYLWSAIDQLAQINQCYAEFTHPRQLAFLNKYSTLGDQFLLGHWGDVFFDDMGVADGISFQDQVEVVLHKIVRRGGMDLASMMWKHWALEGSFNDYLRERVASLLKNIKIENSANARIRAFKSLHWAPRWTSVNLSVFEAAKPILVPYYDNLICEFITKVPEQFLAGRQIQIEYLKKYSPKLAAIPWQKHYPFSVNTYKWNVSPINWPYRAYSKALRLLSREQYTLRNWELQFKGFSNEENLHNALFKNRDLLQLIPTEIITNIWKGFQQTDAVYYSHPISMLLTLSLFTKQNKQRED
jgi:Asparagine synthase